MRLAAAQVGAITVVTCTLNHNKPSILPGTAFSVFGGSGGSVSDRGNPGIQNSVQMQGFKAVLNGSHGGCGYVSQGSDVVQLTGGDNSIPTKGSIPNSRDGFVRITWVSE